MKTSLNKLKGNILGWCDRHKIENYLINDDLTVDIDGDVNLRSKGLSKIPIKFNNVTGSFDCSENYVLHSLKNCPATLGGVFDCSRTPITTLEGAPPILSLITCVSCKNLSLHNVHKVFKKLEQITCDMESPMLGLCLIKEMRLILHPTVGLIMTKYKEDIHLCQEALIDAGLAQYAKI